MMCSKLTDTHYFVWGSNHTRTEPPAYHLCRCGRLTWEMANSKEVNHYWYPSFHKYLVAEEPLNQDGKAQEWETA